MFTVNNSTSLLHFKISKLDLSCTWCVCCVCVCLCACIYIYIYRCIIYTCMHAHVCARLLEWHACACRCAWLGDPKGNVLDWEIPQDMCMTGRSHRTCAWLDDPKGNVLDWEIPQDMCMTGRSHRTCAWLDDPKGNVLDWMIPKEMCLTGRSQRKCAWLGDPTGHVHDWEITQDMCMTGRSHRTCAWLGDPTGNPTNNNHSPLAVLLLVLFVFPRLRPVQTQPAVKSGPSGILPIPHSLAATPHPSSLLSYSSLTIRHKTSLSLCLRLMFLWARERKKKESVIWAH